MILLIRAANINILNHSQCTQYYTCYIDVQRFVLASPRAAGYNWACSDDVELF